eukprot:4140805-Pyramimonas_sp.AAC.1
MTGLTLLAEATSSTTSRLRYAAGQFPQLFSGKHPGRLQDGAQGSHVEDPGQPEGGCPRAPNSLAKPCW